MLLSNYSSFLLRALIATSLVVGTLVQTCQSAIADYDPPGGDPPPGRTSTSGSRQERFP